VERFASHWIIFGTVVAVLALTALVGWEMFFTDEPVVDFRLFRNVPLSVGCGLGVVIGFALLDQASCCRSLRRSC
jgi:hypothetical protein